jgi:bifunctional non-homologous end joining protein LigD
VAHVHRIAERAARYCGFVAEKLRDYRSKRDFRKTPEPSGKGRQRSRSGSGEDVVAEGRFVVQEHDATNLHWDLRLEHDGVAMSWALPRGIPQLPDQSANRLAVRTEDHPLEYLEFQGDIPKGEYGAGTMRIWDRGTYRAEKLRDDEVIASFAGERLSGRYALFRTGGKNWIIHRMDPPLDPERVPLPEDLRPMLPTRGPLPRDPGAYGFEIAWGGLRTVLWFEPGHIRKAESRGLEDAVDRFPELRRIARTLGSTEAVLDGEIVVLGEDGRPDAKALRERKRAASESAARRLSERSRATLMIFDLLFHDGRLTLELPYEERRAWLEELALEGNAWQTPSYHRGEGAALLEAARDRGLPGLVAKRLEAPYEPGKRSRAWVKVEA